MRSHFGASGLGVSRSSTEDDNRKTDNWSDEVLEKSENVPWRVLHVEVLEGEAARRQNPPRKEEQENTRFRYTAFVPIVDGCEEAEEEEVDDVQGDAKGGQGLLLKPSELGAKLLCKANAGVYGVHVEVGQSVRHHNRYNKHEVVQLKATQDAFEYVGRRAEDLGVVGAGRKARVRRKLLVIAQRSGDDAGENEVDGAVAKDPVPQRKRQHYPAEKHQHRRLRDRRRRFPQP